VSSIHHLNLGLLETPLGRACCHGLAIVAGDRVALIDTGIGLRDCQEPENRLGRELIEEAGFVLDESKTAIRQLGALGFSPEQVSDIILTHADPDHTGGVADFPEANVHIATEELDAARSGHPRYRSPHFDHGPRWIEHGRDAHAWQGLPARPVTVCGSVQIQLVELFGHTLGHCGVVIPRHEHWLMHAGDAYYLRAELDDPAHPVGALATLRAEDNARRLASLEALRRLHRELGPSLSMTGYHDEEELRRCQTDATGG